MVAVAGAAAGAKGASASSSMKISGTMDTSNIDRGFSRVNQGFDKTKGNAKSFGSDMARVATTVSGLAKKLVFMGIAGATAMVGIASKAPAVAPALAKMQVEFGKLTRSLGVALAPAFERVAGWLGKLATWVDSNKEKIGEVAMKFIEWAEALGTKLWPWLEKIGNWAMDNPGLFAGIVAGLALTPAILGGIGAVSGLVTTLTGATVAASLLKALGYIAVIGGASYAAYKGASYAVDKAQQYSGMGTDPNAPTDMSGQTLARRLPQKLWADISTMGADNQYPKSHAEKMIKWLGNKIPDYTAPWEDPLNPNSPAHFAMLDDIKERAARGERIGGDLVWSAAPERDRRNWFLQMWDSVWG